MSYAKLLYVPELMAVYAQRNEDAHAKTFVLNLPDNQDSNTANVHVL